MVDNQAADLMSFCASEFQQFFSHLGNSIYTYKNTGKVPSSAFKASGHVHNAVTAKLDKPKAKRKPTAFNMFVKEKMEELKSAGVTLDGDKNNNGMFTLAVSSWKNMSEQAKADYTSKFKTALASAEGELEDADLDVGDLPAPAVLTVAAGDVDKSKKKRKAKSDEDNSASGSKDAPASPQAKPAAAAAAPPAAAEAPEGSEKKKHKKHKKDKKDKSHKKEKEAAE